MPTTSRTEESIFAEALDKRSPEELVAFLDGACGSDVALRARVENLLKSHEHAGSFLRKPLAATVDEVRLAERPGTIIGPYKLLQQIGEGGMGTVYMAEQGAPVRRMVALKIIRQGMESSQVVARFEAERQAVALMDHPNIAKVFDAGTTADGRPYFVMELVKGVPITRFCDEHQLTPRERLELFIPVCQAVQHAHQKGVIHRDLKPSNVLVALYDDRPVPKVIDFGVAKATGEKLTERTMFTTFGSLVGTLEYMSPEQAKVNALDIDTRSDVYALGVLLYELLTGSTPLQRAQLKEAALDELLRLIREQEPARPSTRLSQSGQALVTISSRRRTEPAKLGKMLRGELDWIVMRALEKDRTRRYETANGLARDLQRYLADEPVEACPPSAGYRLRKLVRRYKKPLVAAAAFTVLLVGGTVVSTWQAVRATRAETEAREAKEQVTRELDRALEAEKQAREEKTNAQASLRFLVDDVLAQANPFEQPQRDRSVRSLLDRAASRLDGNKQMPPLLEASIRYSLGKVYNGLGERETAKKQLQRAFELQKEHAGEGDLATLETADALASAYWGQGDLVTARSLAEWAHDGKCRLLGEHHPATLTSLSNLANIMGFLGDAGETASLFAKGVEATCGRAELNRLAAEFKLGLGVAYREMGRYDEAKQLLDEAFQWQRANLKDDNLWTLITRYWRIVLLRQLKRYDDAESEAKETCRLAKEVEQNSLALMSEAELVHIYFAQGKRSDAEPHLQRLREAAQPTMAALPPLIDCMGKVGRDLLEQKDYARAEPFLRVSAGFAEKKYPEGWRRSSLVAALGGCLLGQKKYAEAEPFLLNGFKGLHKCEEKTLKSLTPERRREEAAKVTENVKGLVQLYEETHKPEEAAKWRKLLGERTRKE